MKASQREREHHVQNPISIFRAFLPGFQNHVWAWLESRACDFRIHPCSLFSIILGFLLLFYSSVWIRTQRIKFSYDQGSNPCWTIGMLIVSRQKWPAVFITGIHKDLSRLLKLVMCLLVTTLNRGNYTAPGGR